MNFLTWFSHGVFNLPWWTNCVITLVLTQITILSLSIFLHRAQSHRALSLHPLASHFFRFWLWLTTGMITQEWVAIHRKHHAFADRAGDPHSPHVFGLQKVITHGAELYRAQAKQREIIKKYGKGTPNDWLERKVYAPHNLLGLTLMALIDIALFGALGLSMWALQMLWTPVFAAGIINGVGHYYGYRNFENGDRACNIIPWGIFIAGEELHNNHHTFVTSAKLSVMWYEFDCGWMWIQILVGLRLAKVNRSIPNWHTLTWAKTQVDERTLEALINNHYRFAVKYVANLKDTCQHEMELIPSSTRNTTSWRQLKIILTKDHEYFTQAEELLQQNICSRSPTLHKIFAMRAELSQLWERSTLTKEQLLKQLQHWCQHAENSGILPLEKFASDLRSVRP